MRRAAAWMVLSAFIVSAAGAQQRRVVIASKPFGESYLLAEMFAQLLEARGIAVERRPGLGATEVAFAALRTGAIDVYPEYTGTGLRAILADTVPRTAAEAFAHVQREMGERFGVRWLPPLGFENTYAIAVTRETAARHRLQTLSDLGRASPLLVGGLTPDFIGRPDGLPGLQRIYGVRFREVRPLAQALKYRALTAGAVDVADGYSTDGLIDRYGLTVLRDDRSFFPPYEAAALIGARVQREAPAAVAALSELSGRLDVELMRRLNARVEVRGEPVGAVARDALRELGLVGAGRAERSTSRLARATDWRALRAATVRHLLLVAVALAAAIAVGVTLALALQRSPRAAGGTLAALGVVQTIPSIALLALLIPFLGIGVVPALLALWLYSLYPIVRNTFVGVRDASPASVHAATAMGMSPRQVLTLVRVPLAASVVMAGIRTAAVISVGTATLAAFIGAGGLGEPIAMGLALADTRLVLTGAIPAALLALAVDAGLGLVERAVTPRPLRSA